MVKTQPRTAAADAEADTLRAALRGFLRRHSDICRGYRGNPNFGYWLFGSLADSAAG